MAKGILKGASHGALGLHRTGTNEYVKGGKRYKRIRGNRFKFLGVDKFNPLQTYKTNADYERAVGLRAHSLYDPQLADIAAQGRTEQSKHTGRMLDLGHQTKDYYGELGQAFNDTKAALNNLISTSGAGDKATQATLAGALRGTQDANKGLEGTVGGNIDTSAQSKALMDSFAAGGAQDLGLRGQVAGSLVASGRARGELPHLWYGRGSELETGRNASALEGLTQQRNAVLAQVPQFMEQARKEILDEQRNAQNLKFQQGLAGKQFGLDVRQQKSNEQNLAFQQDLAKAQFNLDTQKFAHQIDLDQATLDLQRDTLISQSKGDPSGAIAKRWANGSSILDGYLAKTKDEQKHPHLHPYRRSFRQAWRLLRFRANMSIEESARLMLSTGNGNWRHVARYILKHHRFPPNRAKRVKKIVQHAVPGIPLP